jgi:hypothetical protein
MIVMRVREARSEENPMTTTLTDLVHWLADDHLTTLTRTWDIARDVAFDLGIAAENDNVTLTDTQVNLIEHDFEFILERT